VPLICLFYELSQIQARTNFAILFAGFVAEAGAERLKEYAGGLFIGSAWLRQVRFEVLALVI